MKYTNKQYASSLISAIADKSGEEKKQALVNFINILKKNGDISKRSQILEEVRREYFKQNGLYKVDVETVSTPPENLAQQIEEKLGGKIAISNKENPDILGGIKILIDDETLIDASVKTQISRVFAKS